MWRSHGSSTPVNTTVMWFFFMVFYCLPPSRSPGCPCGLWPCTAALSPARMKLTALWCAGLPAFSNTRSPGRLSGGHSPWLSAVLFRVLYKITLKYKGKRRKFAVSELRAAVSVSRQQVGSLATEQSLVGKEVTTRDRKWKDAGSLQNKSIIVPQTNQWHSLQSGY